MRKAIPSLLTASRMVAAAIMILVPGTPLFWALYAWCGISDMADGALARRLGSQSELGAHLDSLSDIAFAAACALTLLPFLPLCPWLVTWISLIAACKAADYVSSLAMHRRLASFHTLANKAAGLAVFLSIPTLVFTSNPIYAIPACTLATFAAIQEGHLIRTGALPK